MTSNLASFTDVLGDKDEIDNSQPISLSSPLDIEPPFNVSHVETNLQPQQYTVDESITSERRERPKKHTGQHGDFRSVEEIDEKYCGVFSYPYFNLVQSSVIDDALYSGKSMVVCAPTGSGKTVVFEMAIVQLLMALEDRNYTQDFKIIYMAPVKALCTERLTEWYSKFTRLGLLCIEVTGDTDVDFSQLKSYRIIITTPEKWDMLTRRWRDHHRLVSTIKLFLIDEVHILNDQSRGPVLEAVVSRMKTIEASSQSAYRIEQLQKQYSPAPEQHSQHQWLPEYPRIRFVAVSATVSNPADVAAWLGNDAQPAVYYKFGDECRPVRLKRVVEGYPCPTGCSPFKFDIILNYKLWPIIHKYHNGKPTLIFCNTRKSVALTAETLAKEITISFSPDQKAKLAALASTIKNKKLQSLIVSGVGCHHAGLLFEERVHIEAAFRCRSLPILITTTTLAMGVNLPAHLVIIKNTKQYVNGQYQEYSISTVLQMVGRAGRPQFDSEATAVIMTTAHDKARYQALVEGDEPLQSYLHKRLAENLNSEAALGTVTDVAQCVQWLRSTFLYVRAAKDPKRYLGLPPAAPAHLITKKLEELCVCAMNGLASAGLITMDEASCIESTEAGRLMSVYYIDLDTMKHIMKIKGLETLEQLVWILCESHELADMHLRVDERRCLNALNRNNNATTIRYPMKGKINSRQMKLNCVIQAVLGCLPIAEPALHQEAAKVMRVAERLTKCLVAYVTRSEIVTSRGQYFSAVVNSLTLAKCIAAQLWENSPYVSKQLRGIGPTFSALLASAGKVNFMLLEESHPRDLERIMNKGPPLGNVIRKQVSLLPRYQLTATPRDQAIVTVTLLLLNQVHLSENMDNLTAGDSHKCHIVVGDSENHLLLLTSFKDKDLISMYDGTITYEITRMHNFEHKIFVHCISSKFVGIDAQCEYTFNDLAPAFSRGESCSAYFTQEPNKKTPKQTSITDTFKERKRRNNETDVTQSKEKKKRDNALMDKFKNLKESFGITTKEIKKDLHKTSEMTDILNDTFVPKTPSMHPKASYCVLNDTTELYSRAADDSMMNTCDNEISRLMEQQHLSKSKPQNQVHNIDIDLDYPEMTLESNEDENLNVDDHVEDILSEIENEISKSKDLTKGTKCYTTDDFTTKGRMQDVISYDYQFGKPREPMAEHPPRSKVYPSERKNETGVKSKLFTRQEIYKPSLQTRKRKPTNTRSNFSFIDTLEKKMNSDESNDGTAVQENGFSDAIKKEIEKFLNNAKKTTKQSDTLIQELVGVDKKDENLHKTTTEKNKMVGSTVNNVLTESEKVNIVDLTELPDICVTNDRKADIIDLSELPDVCEYKDHKTNDSFESQDACIDDDNKIKRKSIIETTKWLVPENLESRETMDLDSSHPEPKLSLKDTNPQKPDGNNNDQTYNPLDNCSEIGSGFHGNSTENYVDNSILNYSNETELFKKTTTSHGDHGNHGIDIHTIIAIYDHNRKKNSSVPTKDIETNEIIDTAKTKADYWDRNRNSSPVDSMPLVPLNNAKSNGHNFYLTPENGKNTKSLEGRQLSQAYDSQNWNKQKTIHDKNWAFELRSSVTNNSEQYLKPCQLTEISGMDYNTTQNSSVEAYNAHVSPTVMNEFFTDNKSNKLDDTAKDQYVNKYSFSATKIDVSTKNTAEEKVKIIRKLKVDLDVTEIISRERNKVFKNENVTNEQRQTPCTQPTNTYSGQHLSSDGRQRSFFQPKSIPENREPHQQNKIDKNLQNTTKKSTESNQMKAVNVRSNLHNNLNSRDSQTESFMTNMRKEERNKIFNKHDTTTPMLAEYASSIEMPTKDIKPTHTNKTDNANGNKIKEVSKDHDTVRENVVTGQRINEDSAPSDHIHNKVQNILDKYMKTLRNNTVPTSNGTDIEKPKEDPIVNKGPQKFKRPFKISDINKIDIAVPKALEVEVSRSQMSKNEEAFKAKTININGPINATVAKASRDTFTKPINVYKDVIKDYKTDVQQIMKYENFPKEFENHNHAQINTDNQNELFEDLNDEILETDTDSPLEEISTDFNIEQDMLNPKSLLKRFTKDDCENEEIIPPPEEFCDNTNAYSPTLDKESIHNLSNANLNDFQFYDDSDEDNPTENVDVHTTHDKSIFEENTRNLLTPSKEIETWTFNVDELEDTRSRKFIPPLKCVTVMRNNPGVKEIGQRPTSREAKLNKFRVPTKEKLKL